MRLGNYHRQISFEALRREFLVRPNQPKRFASLSFRPALTPVVLVLFALLGLGSYAGWRYARAHVLEPRRHWRLAQEALERRDLDQALSELESCAGSWPQDADTQFLLARTARRAGKLEQAQEYLTACQHLAEKNPSAFPGDLNLEWALLEAQTGDLAKVESYLRARLDENHADSLFILEALSAALIRNNRLPEARVCLDRWLEQRPDDYEALARHGWVGEHLFDYAGAVNDYRKAVSLRPEQDAMRLHVTGLLLETNELTEAAEHLRILQERQPGSPALLINLAHMRRLEGKPEEAGEFLEQALAKEPENVQALSERGILALQSGRPLAEVEALLRQALERNPAHRPALYHLQMCLERMGKKKEAKELADRLTQNAADIKRLAPLTQEILKKPDDPDLRYEVGKIFLENGYTEDGLRWLGTALKRDPKHRPTHQILADYFQRAGEKDRAAWHRGFLDGPRSTQ
jgi:tetratricopeptide (TPR) repeat protein